MSRSRMQFTPSYNQPMAGPERDPVVADLSGGLELFQRGPERVIRDLFHPDVVQLQQIDPVGLQPLQRGIGRPHDGCRRKILGNLALSAPARFAMRDKS